MILGNEFWYFYIINLFIYIFVKNIMYKNNISFDLVENICVIFCVI